MNFTLFCSCGSDRFKYTEEDGFTCLDCNNQYTEEEAGRNLLGFDFD